MVDVRPTEAREEEMISTAGWLRDAGLKALIGMGVLVVYLIYLALVAFLMRPTLDAIQPLL